MSLKFEEKLFVLGLGFLGVVGVTTWQLKKAQSTQPPRSPSKSVRVEF